MTMIPRIIMVCSRQSVDRWAAAGLEQAGFRVHLACDEATAKRLTDSERPDLLLLSLRLPGQEGRELLRWVREDRARAQIPLVMVAAQADEHDKLLGLELGADDYLTRPFGARELAARVRAILPRTTVCWAAPASLPLGRPWLNPEHQG